MLTKSASSPYLSAAATGGASEAGLHSERASILPLFDCLHIHSKRRAATRTLRD